MRKLYYILGLVLFQLFFMGCLEEVDFEKNTRKLCHSPSQKMSLLKVNDEVRPTYDVPEIWKSREMIEMLAGMQNYGYGLGYYYTINSGVSNFLLLDVDGKQLDYIDLQVYGASDVWRIGEDELAVVPHPQQPNQSVYSIDISFDRLLEGCNVQFMFMANYIDGTYNRLYNTGEFYIAH